MKDDQGADYPNLEAAREAALPSVRELVAENVHSNSEKPVEAAIITDESGKEVMTVSAKEVLLDSLK